jgi:hypothetical protein
LRADVDTALGPKIPRIYPRARKGAGNTSLSIWTPGIVGTTKIVRTPRAVGTIRTLNPFHPLDPFGPLDTIGRLRPFCTPGTARFEPLLTGRLILAPGGLTRPVAEQTDTRVFQSPVIWVFHEVFAYPFDGAVHRLSRRIRIRDCCSRAQSHTHADSADKNFHETLPGFPAKSSKSNPAKAIQQNQSSKTNPAKPCEC